MNPSLLEILRCPASSEALTLQADAWDRDRVRDSWFASASGAHRHPNLDCAARLVQESNTTVRRGLAQAGFDAVEVLYESHLVGRGRRPA